MLTITATIVQHLEKIKAFLIGQFYNWYWLELHVFGDKKYVNMPLFYRGLNSTDSTISTARTTA